MRVGPGPRSPLRALVTAPQQDEVVEVDVPSGRIVRRLAVPGEPEYAATCCGPTGEVAIASPGNGTVTLAGAGTLRPERVLRGFGAPHIIGFAAPADDVDVTDDARGTLDVIALGSDRVIARVSVGTGAHHFATSPDGRQIWVALGQSASTIAVLSTVVRPPAGLRGGFADPGRPHVVGHFAPGFRAHQLLFTPDGRRVWITAADRSRVAVFDVRTRRRLFSVPAGAPPQHIAFAGRFAYVTSGYGGRIEQVDRATGRVLTVAAAPYGSFELDAGGGYVVTSSLLRGTLTIYDASLRRRRVLRVAASAEDVVVSGG